MKEAKMAQANQKREIRKMNAPFNKIVAKGTMVEWTDSQKEAEAAYKESVGNVQWWIVQANGTASLHAQKLK